MWNCDWEYQHQDVLKNCYERKMAGRPYGKNDPVRKIICEGCGCVFYTRIGGADENLDQTEVEVSACIAMKNGKKQWNYISSMGIGQRQ